jgi:hypothetical protein
LAQRASNLGLVLVEPNTGELIDGTVS